MPPVVSAPTSARDSTRRTFTRRPRATGRSLLIAHRSSLIAHRSSTDRARLDRVVAAVATGTGPDGTFQAGRQRPRRPPPTLDDVRLDRVGLRRAAFDHVGLVAPEHGRR